MSEINQYAPVSDYFGELTFGLGSMREKLPKDAYANLVRTLEKGEKLSEKSAESIALAIKRVGRQHRSHTFLSLVSTVDGLTAEKT